MNARPPLVGHVGRQNTSPFLRLASEGWQRNLAVCLVSLIVIALQMRPMPDRIVWGSDFGSLAVVAELDGRAPFTPDSPLFNNPSRPASIGYVAVLWVAAKIDPSMLPAAACAGRYKANCTMPFAFQWVVWLQLIASAVCILLIGLIAAALIGDWQAFFLAVFFAAFLNRFVDFSFFVTPYVFFCLTFLMALLFLILSMRFKRQFMVLLSGLFFSISSLFHFESLLATPLIMAALMWLLPGGVRWTAAAVVAFGLGLAVPLAPIVAVHLIHFGDPLLSVASQVKSLSGRVAFNTVVPENYLPALLFWFPIGGQTLTAGLFGQEAANLLGLSTPGSVFRYGSDNLWRDAHAKGPGLAPLQWLLNDHVLASPLTHVAATVPLFLRGFWTSCGLMALPLLYYFATVIRIARVRGRSDAAIVLAISTGGLLVANALLTPGSYWLNLPVVALPCCYLTYLFRDI